MVNKNFKLTLPSKSFLLNRAVWSKILCYCVMDFAFVSCEKYVEVCLNSTFKDERIGKNGTQSGLSIS